MNDPVVITGAGPAGLTAAYELVKRGIKPLVLEKSGLVGGISRTETYKGYRFDIGGHRFFTKVSEVEQLWREVLGRDLLTVRRLSRIFYRGKFYQYPLEPLNTVLNLGPKESAHLVLSYLKTKVQRPYPDEDTFEEWVSNRFGKRLFHLFFKTYTEKVWGIPCSKIRADWAAQRIKSLSLRKALINAFFKTGNETSLIEQFLYPVNGPGMMWERFHRKIEERGGTVALHTETIRLEHRRNRIEAAVVRKGDVTSRIRGSHYINSMPINRLVERLDPLPPDPVLEAARNLAYRDFLVVALILDRSDLFPDNWIYIHSPEVRVGRIQNFKNWSPAMVPDPSTTCLGMEYFCNRGDELWNQPDAELIKLAGRELSQIGLTGSGSVLDGTVIRQPMAYPVYDETYRQNLEVIRTYLDRFENLQTVGRAGMHRYNNQDHSMLTAILAVRNILGERHDLWNVNVERSYHEEHEVKETVLQRKKSTERLVSLEQD